MNKNNKYLKDNDFIKQLILENNSVYLLMLVDLDELNYNDILKVCFEVNVNKTLSFLIDNNKIDLVDVNLKKDILKK